MTSEARLVVNIVTVSVTDFAVIGACVFAWIKGQPAERFGAALYFASSAGTLLYELAIGQDIPIIMTLLLDTTVAVGFLLLAIRYNNMWLGGAMLVKGMQLALHATHLTDVADAKFGPFDLYYLSLDAVSLLISLTIFGGTLSGIMARRRAGSGDGSGQSSGPGVRSDAQSAGAPPPI